jgi:hypothetical protein
MADDGTFSGYLDLSKEELRKLLDATQIKLEQLAHVLDLDPDAEEVAREYNLEEERYHWLKLALVASDDHAMLSTVNLEECGSTLDINRGLGGGRTSFKVDLKKKGQEAKKEPTRKDSHDITPVKKKPLPKK